MSAPAEDRTGFWSRHKLIPLFVFLVGVVSQLATFQLIPLGQMDDAGLTLRAVRLVQPAEGPGVVNVKIFAPGWPLALASVYAVTGDVNTWGRLLSVAFTAAAGTGLYLLFRWRGCSHLVGFLVAWLFFQSPKTLELGSSLMSEPCSYFVTVLCLASSLWVRGWAGHLGLGALAGWAATVRPEGMLVAAAAGVAMLAKPKTSRFAVVMFAVTTLVTRYLINSWTEWLNVHNTVVSDFFQSKGLDPVYFLKFLAQNSQISASALLGWSGAGLWVAFWPLLLIGLGVTFFKTDRDKSVRERLRDPLLLWVLLYGAGLAVWPYFSERYWPLWAAACVGLALGWAPPKVRVGFLVALALIQLPSALAKYRLSPQASRFSSQVYLPFYEKFGDHGPVMSLFASRVQLLARVPAYEPLYRTDFQSIPIAMAHYGCRYIEWENSDRSLATLEGEQVRPYPSQAHVWLQASTLFAKHHDCGFATCYELKVDPGLLKQAGSLYSQAMQTSQPEPRLALLEQAHRTVSDLPELRAALLLARRQNGQQTWPDEVAFFEQYPHHTDFGVGLVQRALELGQEDEARRIATTALEHLNPGLSQVAEKRRFLQDVSAE